MASLRIEEIMRQASAKDQAVFKNSVQQFKDNNVQFRTDSYGPQTPTRRAERPNATEPKLNETVFPNQRKPEQPQRGAKKINQAKTEIQIEIAEPIQTQERNIPTQTQDNKQEFDR